MALPLTRGRGPRGQIIIGRGRTGIGIHADKYDIGGRRVLCSTCITLVRGRRSSSRAPPVHRQSRAAPPRARARAGALTASCAAATTIPTTTTSAYYDYRQAQARAHAAAGLCRRDADELLLVWCAAVPNLGSHYPRSLIR